MDSVVNPAKMGPRYRLHMWVVVMLEYSTMTLLTLAQTFCAGAVAAFLSIFMVVGSLSLWHFVRSKRRKRVEEVIVVQENPQPTR